MADINLQNINERLHQINNKLAEYVSLYFGQPIEEIKAQLVDNLILLQNILPKLQMSSPQDKKLIKSIKEALEEKSRIEIEQQKIEKRQAFFHIEQDVMTYLDHEERQRIQATISQLRELYGDRYEEAYQEALMMLRKGDVIIKKNSVQFFYANTELDRYELQFPEEKNVVNTTYNDFGKQRVTRNEIWQMVLDEEQHPAHHFFQNTKLNMAKQGKYMATKENAFDRILSGFGGELDQQMKGMQILRGFVGKVFVSEKKNANHCHTIIKFEQNKHHSNIRDYSRGDTTASIIFAKYC